MDSSRPFDPEKPGSASGYPPFAAELCERTLVTLVRGLGPWKKSIVLIGGLAPRYLIDQRTLRGNQAPHVGTLDIDLVVELEVLAQTEAYARLEQNLKRLGFERTSNEEGNPRHFQWRKSVSGRQSVVVDLLQDAEPHDGGRGIVVPGERRLSALGIPGAKLALKDFIEVAITAEMLDDRGVTTEMVRVCGIVPFLVLKLLAYEDRFEMKDAYDIVYCVMNYSGGPEEVGKLLAKSMHAHIDDPFLLEAYSILQTRFLSETGIDGTEKDGPVSYAGFLSIPGEGDAGLLRRQDAVAVIELMMSSSGAERARLAESAG